jgi:cytidylate kinase
VIIAIDGPAASGKGTLAKRLAETYRLPHLDTGLLYRATARAVLDRGAALDDREAAVRAAETLDPLALDEARLRGKEMGEAASIVAAVPAVRAALLAAQRAFAGRPGGAVLDGRDIGTVICPSAPIKIFVTASPEARAERRWRELVARGEPVKLDDVLADIRRRDARDSDRASAPLRVAEDAIRLDTTTLDVEAAFARAREIVESRRAGAG